MTTEEKAKAYAENTLVRTISRPAHPLDKLAPYFASKDIQQAYLAGATEALASQWVSVEDLLPEDDETVLTLSSYGPVLAYYSKQDEMWFAYGNYGDITPTHWLPIPPLKGGDA